ncbi:hypothetical protein Tco_1374590, partial [Tanacetum coccineum]
MAKSFQTEFSKILSAHDFSSSLPTKLKDLSSKFNELTEEVKGLKQQVHELELATERILKEFLQNLKSLQRLLQVALVQAKLKTLDALPGLFLNVTKVLNKFAQVLDSALSKAGDQSSSQPEGENIKKDKGKKAMSSKDAEEKIEEDAKAEAARRECKIRKEELIDLLGPEVVNKKGPITLKIYREDDTSKIILEFKASDLHLGKWREVVTACPNKKSKGWTSIYKQIHERMDYLHTTKAELGIDLDRPLSEQDPLDRLNDLANKKRKHADDIHDFFRANKRLKSSVQYKDHPAGTVLNELVL